MKAISVFIFSKWSVYLKSQHDNLLTLLQCRTYIKHTVDGMNFSFFPYKMDIHNCLDKTSQLDQEHKNGSLSLSRIHIGLNHTRDRIINYIYLKDNKLYSLVKNTLKCPEWSHTEIPRENTIKY